MFRRAELLALELIKDSKDDTNQLNLYQDFLLLTLLNIDKLLYNSKTVNKEKEEDYILSLLILMRSNLTSQARFDLITKAEGFFLIWSVQYGFVFEDISIVEDID